MATVVDLVADPRLTCPGERAVVTATTDTDEVVDWFVDGVPAEATGDAAGVNGNEFRVRLRQGELKVIEARIDGTALSLTVEGKVAGLRVEFVPEAGGDMPVITAAPDMPCGNDGVGRRGRAGRSLPGRRHGRLRRQRLPAERAD